MHLDLRKQILDLNVQYHTRAKEFFDRMNELEASCTDALIPVEKEAVKQFLSRIHDQKRALLESLNGALQAGNSLIGKLKELGAEGTLDSRPDRIRSSVNRGNYRSCCFLFYGPKKLFFLFVHSNFTSTKLDGRVTRQKVRSRRHLFEKEKPVRTVPCFSYISGRFERIR